MSLTYYHEILDTEENMQKQTPFFFDSTQPRQYPKVGVSPDGLDFFAYNKTLRRIETWDLSLNPIVMAEEIPSYEAAYAIRAELWTARRDCHYSLFGNDQLLLALPPLSRYDAPLSASTIDRPELWTRKNGKLELQSAEAFNGARGACFTAVGRFAVSQTNERIRLLQIVQPEKWTVDSEFAFKILKSLDFHIWPTDFEQVLLSPHGNTICSICRRSLWWTKTGKVTMIGTNFVSSSSVKNDWITSAAFPPLGRKLALGTAHGQIIVIELSNDAYRELTRFQLPGNWRLKQLHYLDWSKNGQFLGIGTDSGFYIENIRSRI